MNPNRLEKAKKFIKNKEYTIMETLLDIQDQVSALSESLNDGINHMSDEMEAERNKELEIEVTLELT